MSIRELTRDEMRMIWRGLRDGFGFVAVDSRSEHELGRMREADVLVIFYANGTLLFQGANPSRGMDIVNQLRETDE